MWDQKCSLSKDCSRMHAHALNEAMSTRYREPRWRNRRKFQYLGGNFVKILKNINFLGSHQTRDLALETPQNIHAHKRMIFDRVCIQYPSSQCRERRRLERMRPFLVRLMGVEIKMLETLQNTKSTRHTIWDSRALPDSFSFWMVKPGSKHAICAIENCANV